MDLMNLFSYIILLLCLLFTLIAESTSRSFDDLDTFISTPLDIESRFNDDYFANYQTRPAPPRDSLLNRLRNGYYFIDDGKITPVNPTDFNQNIPAGRRRQDTNEADQNDVKYTPPVRYRQPHAKHKKLFVPNFFG